MGAGDVAHGRPGSREGEGEARTQARPFARGPNPSPVRLDNALADGQAQARVVPLVLGFEAQELAEEMGQPPGGYAVPLVGHRERNMDVFPNDGHPDDRRLLGMPGRVGQQVAQNLHDAPSVRHHQGQVRLDFDDEAVPAPRVGEAVSGPVHERGHLRGFGIDRQRSRLDARHVQQVGDQSVHVVGLVLDDPEELADHRRIEVGGGIQDGGGGALDGGQRDAQFVAYRCQKLRPHSLQFPKGRHVLKCDDHRLQLALPVLDGRCADNGGDTPPVGDAENELLAPYRLPCAQHLGQRCLLHPVPEALLEPARIQPCHDPSQRVVRGDAVRQGPEGAQPLLIALAAEGEGHEAVGTADHRQHRQDQDICQGMQPGPAAPRIFQGIQKLDQGGRHRAVHPELSTE